MAKSNFYHRDHVPGGLPNLGKSWMAMKPSGFLVYSRT
jgi:hypothetical protein